MTTKNRADLKTGFEQNLETGGKNTAAELRAELANIADSVFITATDGIAQITGLQTALDAKATTTSVNTLTNQVSDLSNSVTGISTSVGTINSTLSNLNQDQIADGTTNKSYTATEKTKLSGIATGATANSTDAQLRDRSTHTGTQTADTITDGTTNKAYTATEKTKLSTTLVTNPTGITGATAATNLVIISQANYDAIVTKDATTVYIIVG